MLADTSRMPFGPLEGRGTEARSRRSGTRIGRAGHWARDRGGGGQGPGSGDNRSDRSGLQDASDWRDQTGSFWRRAAQQRGVVAKARSPMQSLAEMGLGQAGGCADGAPRHAHRTSPSETSPGEHEARSLVRSLSVTRGRPCKLEWPARARGLASQTHARHQWNIAPPGSRWSAQGQTQQPPRVCRLAAPPWQAAAGSNRARANGPGPHAVGDSLGE